MINDNSAKHNTLITLLDFRTSETSTTIRSLNVSPPLREKRVILTIYPVGILFLLLSISHDRSPFLLLRRDAIYEYDGFTAICVFVLDNPHLSISLGDFPPGRPFQWQGANTWHSTLMTLSTEPRTARKGRHDSKPSTRWNTIQNTCAPQTSITWQQQMQMSQFDKLFDHWALPDCTLELSSTCERSEGGGVEEAKRARTRDTHDTCDTDDHSIRNEMKFVWSKLTENTHHMITEKPERENEQRECGFVFILKWPSAWAWSSVLEYLSISSTWCSSIAQSVLPK